MAINQASLTSNPTAVPVAPRMQKGNGALYWLSLAVGMGVAALTIPIPFVGSAGSLLSYLPFRFSNSIEAKNQQESIANHFRVQIAERMGIAPEAVTRQHLLELAAKDEAFGKLIETSLHQQNSNNRNALIGSVVGTVIPGATIVQSLGTNLVANTAASVIFDKNEISIIDTTDHFDQVRASGGMVQPEDVMLLRVAQNDELQAQIMQDFGAKFHKLSPMKRVEAMQALPKLYQACMRDAARLNSGRVTSQALAVEPPPAMNHRQAVLAQRAAAAAPKQKGA